VVTSILPGSGSGTLTYLVAPNLGGAREGTLLIGGNTFTVTQSGILGLPGDQAAR
jgi:hypothetical protein